MTWLQKEVNEYVKCLPGASVITAIVQTRTLRLRQLGPLAPWPDMNNSGCGLRQSSESKTSFYFSGSSAALQPGTQSVDGWIWNQPSI